ncbi:MAG: hypothetical protein HY790_09625 [Deltaproteobacteria bacterium]|nr:hypothetical protein [Deltaproteobacteria bacterium]MBI4796074.1 hypothetical protein [Deltaproteobacteria bacterium]
MSLGQFETGWGWEAQIRQYARKKYRQDLEGLRSLDPGLLARLLGGEVLEGRPYASIKWVLRVKPFRPLELYLLFDYDGDHGADLRVFYARKSLIVPTEDAYVFAWDYLAIVARYGRGSFPLEAAGPGKKWLPFRDFAAALSGPLENVSLGPRRDLLLMASPEVVEVAVRRLDSGVYQATPDGWEIVWPLLGDLLYRLQVSSGELQIAFDDHGARKYAPELLISFAWLYLNALLRECRQVDPALPRLSRYL